jgi:hypothetical protein
MCRSDRRSCRQGAGGPTHRVRCSASDPNRTFQVAGGTRPESTRPAPDQATNRCRALRRCRLPRTSPFLRPEQARHPGGRTTRNGTCGVAGQRSGPEDLGLVLLARPHTLPDGIGWFSHGLLDPADSGHPDAVQQALASVKDELDRGVAVGSTADADLVLVVRELGDLKPDALNAPSAIAATGPHYQVRLLVASEQSVAEMLRTRRFTDQLMPSTSWPRWCALWHDDDERLLVLGTLAVTCRPIRTWRWHGARPQPLCGLANRMASRHRRSASALFC